MKNKLAFCGISNLLAAAEQLWPEANPVTVLWTEPPARFFWQRKWMSSVLMNPTASIILLNAHMPMSQALSHAQHQLMFVIQKYIENHPSEIAKLPHAGRGARDIVKARIYKALQGVYEDRMQERTQQLLAEGMPIVAPQGLPA